MIIEIGKPRTTVFMIILLCLAGCKNASVIYPVRKDIIEAVYASGRIVSVNEFKLASMSTGTIIQKLVKDGDTVQQGQLLYVISNESAKERYHAAQKNYNIVTVNLSDKSPLLNDLKLSLQNATMKCSNDSSIYFRYKNLWAQDIGTKSNLDNVYTNYQLSLNQKKMAEQKYHSALNDLAISHGNARSQLAAADKELKEYFIRSDRNGVVYQTFKEAGEAVYTNEVVALIGEHRNQMIRLAVDQQDINKIQAGQQVLLQTDITGDTVYEAAVSYIYPVMNEQDQTFRVDAIFTKKSAPSFIHSSVEANIIVQNKKDALVLPRNALAANDSVWVLEKSSRKKTAVRTGIVTLDYIEIIAGIDEKTAVLPVTKNDTP